MPTYDYVCDSCGHEFEEFQMMSAKPLKKCPDCGKAKLRRLIGTGAGIIFKGGGFYETDYRSDGYKKAEKADQPSSDKASSEKPSSSSDKPSGGDKSPSTTPEPKKTTKATDTKPEGKKPKSD